MATAKDLGVWMDQSSANLMEFTTNPDETRTIMSKFTYDEKEESQGKSENSIHNKEKHEQARYYRNLGNIIRNYEEVVLFGPSEVKVELYNALKDNHLFSKIKIEMVHTDDMTENQQHAFIKEHFSRYMQPL